MCYPLKIYIYLCICLFLSFAYLSGFGKLTLWYIVGIGTEIMMEATKLVNCSDLAEIAGQRRIMFLNVQCIYSAHSFISLTGTKKFRNCERK